VSFDSWADGKVFAAGDTLGIHRDSLALYIFSLYTTTSFPKCLTPLIFLNIFDHSSYSKTFVKYVKLYVYIKIYLTMNQMVGKELIIA
jgi:hypothetical protein